MAAWSPTPLLALLIAVLLLVVASDEAKKATANTATLSVALETFMVEGGWLGGLLAHGFVRSRWH